MNITPDYTLSRPVENPTFRVINMGAGVQSTVMALLAAKNIIGPRPDHMIFADTQWEPKGVYKHLDWLEKEITRLTNGLTVLHRVTQGNIRENVIESKNTTGQRFVALPFYTSDSGMGKRQCTREYKIQPIERKIREIAGLKFGEKAPKDLLVEQWVGISWDEMERMRVSDKKYVHMRYPLIELQWRRYDCLRWFNKEYPGRELKKSSCIGCPFHDNTIWRDMKINDPESWNDAVEIDKAIRDGGTLRGMKQKQYMHRSCKPLSEVDVDSLEDKGQGAFLGECEGMCGT